MPCCNTPCPPPPAARPTAQECNRRLAELVWQAAQEVLRALPPGSSAHANKPSHYHITVYMTSQPHTLRCGACRRGAAPASRCRRMRRRPPRAPRVPCRCGLPLLLPCACWPGAEPACCPLQARPV